MRQVVICLRLVLKCLHIRWFLDLLNVSLHLCVARWLQGLQLLQLVVLLLFRVILIWFYLCEVQFRHQQAVPAVLLRDTTLLLQSYYSSFCILFLFLCLDLLQVGDISAILLNKFLLVPNFGLLILHFFKQLLVLGCLFLLVIQLFFDLRQLILKLSSLSVYVLLLHIPQQPKTLLVIFVALSKNYFLEHIGKSLILFLFTHAIPSRAKKLANGFKSALCFSCIFGLL